MKLNNLKPQAGARDKKRYRVGRGMAQGRGKQAGKGQSGQNKRGGTRPGFEGGQNQWFRRLPKIGFKNIHRKEYQIVSLAMLDTKYKANANVDYDSLLQVKLIKKRPNRIKILANGTLSKKLIIKVDAASQAAQTAVKKAGGTIILSDNNN